MEFDNTEQQYEPQVNAEGFFNDLTSQNACSVRVAVRVRPLVGRELYEGNQKICVDVDEFSNKIQIGEKNFQFDRVFPLQSQQEDIFEICARNLVLGCFAGYNATILAYGQTGSGKTHTMGTGSTAGLSEDQIGLLPRVFQFIFQELENRKKVSQFSEFTIKISFLELYNEELHDLLDTANMGVDKMTGKALKELQIKEKNGNIYVQGLKEEQVQSKEECIQLLNKGISHRTTSATLMNEGSSRSHGIFTVTIEQRIVKEIQLVSEDAVPGQEVKELAPAASQEELISAKFHFVDLAGSERIKRTGATGILLKEGISINKGLLCLGNVISALTEESKKNNHIPYRDSKLTRILQDSLGGNSRTTMIACVSPADSNYEESLNAIKYASRARNIKNKPVVNRDPNSMLIDSLRTQISNLQSEVKEYQNILQANSINVPENFQSLVQQRADTKKTPMKSQTIVMADHTSPSMGQGMNFAELRDVKIKLSRKEKELKDLQEQLEGVLLKVSYKDSELSDLQKERDTLRIKNEILTEFLQQNNISFDETKLGENGQNDQKLSIIDQYKQKMQQMERDLEIRDNELQQKNKKIAELQIQSQRDEEILRKHLEENQKLKRQIKKLEDQNINFPQSPVPQSTKNITSKLKLNLQSVSGPSTGSITTSHRKNQSDAEGLFKRKSLEGIQIPDLNERFINNLTNQLESLFTTAQDDQVLNSARSIRSNKGDDLGDNLDRFNSMEDVINHALQDSNNLLEDDNGVQLPNIEEKEKILETIKSSAKQMQNELVELMKHEYEKKVQELEDDLLKVETEKQDKLKKVTQNDSKEKQAIDLQYKQKMEELSKQLQMFKEKEKKQEQVSKQLNMNQSKIKNLEEDIQKMRKKEEDLEKLRKNENEKFTKYKQTISKELTQVKKTVNEKEKVVQKLKQDLKKVDSLAQKKISELKGFQKKIYEERQKREQEKKEEYESKGIDIDRIKVWINENTRRMLEHRELKETLEENIAKKEQIEEDMIAEGEKLTEFMIQKDRIEFELQQLALESEPDEGRIMELEEDQYQLTMQIQSITEALDSMDETVTFVNNKINKLTEDVIALDIDNIEPIKFSGLQSVDAARVTLQTFFSVLLDLNIYQKELEVKCIESDEAILGLNEKVSSLNLRIDELSLISGSKNDSAQDPNNRINTIQKDKAIKNLVDLSHKLEQALSDKESFKLKFDNLRKKNKNDLIAKDPLQFKDQQQLEKDQKDSKFSSLAQARERRKQVVNPATGDTTQDSALDITAITKSSGGNSNNGSSNLQLKFQQRKFQRPGTSLEESVTKPTHPSRQQLQSQQSVKVPPRKANEISARPKNTSTSQDRGGLQSLREKQNNSKLAIARKSPKKVDSNKIEQPQLQQPTNLNSLLNRKQLQPISEFKNGNSRNQMQSSQSQNQPISKVLNFRDRRNQRKLEHNDGDKVEQDKVHEIDRLKEETMLITQGTAHQERRQSRARAYSKKGFGQMHAFNQLNQSVNIDIEHNDDLMAKLDQLSNMKDFMEPKQPDSPRMSRSSKKLPPKTQMSQPMIDVGYLEKQQHQEVYQSDVSENFDNNINSNNQINDRDKWTYEEFAMLENFGQRLIGCDCAIGKIILIFDNFTVREISIETMEEINMYNLFQVNGMGNIQEIAIDFAIDKELNAIAVTSDSTTYVFDFSDEYKCLTKIEVGGGIQKVEFCQYNIVVLVKQEQSSFIVSYEMDSEPIEKGYYELKTEGYPEMIVSDNQFIYFAHGIKVGKISMPDLQPLFIIETEHQDVINNLNIGAQIIVTSSKDNSIRVHDIETGEQILEPVNDMICDQLNVEGNFILTKSNQDQHIIVWKQEQLSIELNMIDYVQLDNPEQEILDFTTKGKILARFTNGVQYDLVLLVTSTPEAFLISALKHKPLSEM